MNPNELLRRYAAGERNFSGVDLSGADLSGAYLHNTNFTKANLYQANLTKANITSATLVGTNLEKATLIGAQLTKSDLNKANLEEADLTGAKLVNSDLTQSNLCQAQLNKANIRYATLNCAFLHAASLDSAILYGANMCGAILVAANLSQAKINNACLKGANLIKATLSEADLRYASLIRSNLAYAKLNKVKLDNTDFSDANLAGTDFTDTDWSKANLNGTILSRIVNPILYDMDWTVPLRSLQVDFIQRLQSSSLLRSVIEGQHSELTVISGARLLQLRDFSWKMADKYKKNSTDTVRDVFIKNLKGKLGEEVVKIRLANLVTEVDYEQRICGDSKVDFTMASNPNVGIQVKARHSSIDTVQWSISSEEVEKNTVLVCVFIQEEVNEAQAEYHLILAGFLPTSLIHGDKVGINQLLYAGGLRSYLEFIAKKVD
jgi:uncharacterized protein YjbI with pentapeptide repeats